MTMAVVEQAAQERTPRSPHQQLGLSSLLGAVIVLFCFAFVLGGLPTMWDTLLGISADRAAGRTPVINEFLGGALLLLLILAVSGVLFWFMRSLERNTAQPGLRAGVIFGAIAITLILALATKLGATMESAESNVMGVAITGVILGALLFAVGWLFTRPGFGRWLIGIEQQGWFHATPYKGNQGIRVRRGTILALLVVGICGIYSLVSGGSFGAGRFGSNDWIWPLPFTTGEASEYMYLPITHSIHIVLPILLAAAVLWIAWRVVNWPTFADFLIATEAEMNKVSWTTRRRLVQDTIVVLVTVFLFTAYLFLVDILWIKVLTHPFVSVLQVDIKEAFQKQQEKTQW
jgi:preprotein translocase SecE subunit